MSEEGTWQTCVVDEEYEIFSEYPHPIRRVGSDKIIKEWIETTGYYRCSLNKVKYYKHQIIAEQFIPNSNQLPCVDHIDHNKLNNSISNLRRVSVSENNFNKSSSKGIDYEFVDEIPNDCFVVDYYGKHEFEDLYFYDDVFYFYNGIRFRKLHINESKSGSLFVCTYDTDGKNVHIYYSKFKRQFGLI